MGRLFGTDGARGVANSELTCELSMQIGRAAAMVLTENLSHRPKVMIGMDTRASSEMLEASIAAGLCSVGADVLLLGVVPTPAVAFLVKEYGYDAGVMISASHNPCEYNGIKIFQSTGYKLPDELENEIESIILDDAKVPPLTVNNKIVARINESIFKESPDCNILSKVELIKFITLIAPLTKDSPFESISALIICVVRCFSSSFSGFSFSFEINFKKKSVVESRCS